MLPARAPDVSRRRHAVNLLTRPDEFGVVLFLILATIVVFAGVDGQFGKLISVALSGGTLLFVLHTSQANRRTFRLAAVIVTMAVLSAAGTLLFGHSAGLSAAGLVGLLLAVLAPLVILRRIVLSPRITFRLVLGALSIYLLLGLAYAYLFPLVGSLTGTSFFVQTTAPTSAEYVYFSYTTLATVGYGDYTAATSVGRIIAVSEALVGQLYLVSAVALLVANIGRELPQRKSDGGPVTPLVDRASDGQ